MQVLIIDCDPRHASTVSRVLNSAGAARLRVAEDLESALAALDEGSFDAVLLCLWARGCEASLAAVQRVRRRAPLSALVVVDVRADEHTAAACMQAGAQEYVVKRELAPAALARAVRCAALRQCRQSKLGGALARARARCRRLWNSARGFGRLDHAAHDIRAPLALVKDLAAALSEGQAGVVNAEQRRQLQAISRRVDEVVAVADGLLERSRAAAGEGRLPRAEVDAATLVASVWPLLEHDARRHGVQLALDVPDDLPPVHCRAGAACRALTNVALNAIKFSGGRSAGRVQVAARRGEGKCVEFVVTDNGPGMSAEQRRAALAPFRGASAERGAEDVDVARRGYGLGLSIARALMEEEGGSLRLESAPGVGTAVRLVLPEVEAAGGRVERPHFLKRRAALVDSK